MPSVSVIAPAYNHAKYIDSFIRSILSQTYTDFELVITDDASTDGTAEEIERFTDSRIKFFRQQKNRGMIVTSSNSWKHSSGELIAWIGTDDIAQPWMLARLEEYLREHPECLGVFGLADYMDEDGNLMSDPFPSAGVGADRFQLLKQLFYCRNPICAPAGMVRRQILEELGYFQPNLAQVNDMSMWIRILFRGEMAVIGDKVLKYRLRSNNANASGERQDSLNQRYFEFFEVMDLFRENITTVELLTQIFPEVVESLFPLDERLIPFHLAQLAIKADLSCHKLFGLHLLFKLTSESSYAQYLRETCNFDYPDLFRLEGEQSIFREIAKRFTESELVAENNHLRAESRVLEKRLDDVLSSASWKITEPLRLLRRGLG